MNNVWSLIEKTRESCPAYHCRTGQVKPDKVFTFNVDNIEIKVCHICYHTLKKEVLAVTVERIVESDQHQANNTNVKPNLRTTERVVYGSER